MSECCPTCGNTGEVECNCNKELPLLEMSVLGHNVYNPDTENTYTKIGVLLRSDVVKKLREFDEFLFLKKASLNTGKEHLQEVIDKFKECIGELPEVEKK